MLIRYCIIDEVIGFLSESAVVRGENMAVGKKKFKEDFLKKLITMHAKSFEEATNYERYSALGSLIRDYAAMDWIRTDEEYRRKNTKQVYYFSIEFLLGKLLGSNLLNMGLEKVCEGSASGAGLHLEGYRVCRA